MTFTKAVRKKAKLRLALTGPSGSGKTYGALLIAGGMGKKIAVIDTEHDSASLYAGAKGLPEFDSMNLAPPYTPERFIAAIKEAEKAGYEVLVVDSITHEWNGSGGCLEINEALAHSRFRGNTWSAWNDTTPRHRAFIDTIVSSPLHIIATMRSKTETTQTEDAGKKKIIKLGMKSEQRDGSDYEFTVVLDIIHDGHYAVASKDRTGLFTDKDPKKITTATGKMLLDWLNSGADEPKPIPLPEDVIADFVSAIESAATETDLRREFAPAYRAADLAKDDDAMKRFVAAKDAAKAKFPQQEAA
jgi:hypothetical protein